MVANLNDEAQSWYMQADGSYRRVPTEGLAEPFSAHTYFMSNPSLSGRGSAREGNVPPAFDHVGPRSQ
jgi:polyphosphate kinase